MASKRCPDCRESIKIGAIVCKHCGRRWADEEVAREKNASGHVGAVVVVALVIVALAAALNRGDDDSTEPAYIGKHNPVILEGAVDPMTPAAYPKMHARLGAAAFDRANDLSPAAASVVAADLRCDALEYLGVSDQSTAQSIEWFGDCSNGYRRRVKEGELKEIP